MKDVLVSLHVLAVILTVGPVTVATSMFPRYVRARTASGAGADEVHRADAGLALLQRISVGYALASLTVPVFGIAAAVAGHKFDQGWLMISMTLTLVAAAVLVAVVLLQRRVLPAAGASPDAALVARTLRLLPMLSGVFALLWLATTVLMVLQPGAPPDA